MDESWLVVEKTKNGDLTDTVVAPVPVANGAACDGTEGVGGGDQPLQLSRSVAEEQVDPASPVTKRPTHLFEEGSMVEVRGYGFGVVQWLGQMRGRDTAGVELVTHETHTQSDGGTVCV